MNDNIRLALVDDHNLLRTGLAGVLDKLDYKVIMESENGRQFIDKLDKENLPDVVLMDINMPEMDGFETTLWLKKNHPLVKVLALSMFDDENSIIRMLKNGARGYILKDSRAAELKAAIEAVVHKGFYYSELVSGSLLHSLHQDGDEDDNDNDSDLQKVLKLKPRDIEFLKLVCTELTYKEIAERMFLSPRTIDGYRDDLFQELGVKSRVGLVIFAIKNGIVHFK
jgi:two-component system invasion response regulator UvrY